MNPNAGEPGNQGSTQGGVAVADKPISASPPLASPDISRVEDLVTAAQQEAVAAQTTPKAQFENQFGSGVTPPAAEAPIAPLDPNINTVGDLLAQGPQVVEQQSEVKLPPKVQEFLDAVLNAAEEYKASEEEKSATSF